MIERAAIEAIAAAAIALLVAGYGAARAEDELFDLGISHPKPTAADVTRAKALAGEADQPGERSALLLAPILGGAGRTGEAVALLRGAVKREPENAEAWLLLSRVIDPTRPEAKRAAQRVRELAPPVPEPPG